MDKLKERRKLSYFGHKDDGRCTLYIQHMKTPTFWYRTEQPLKFEKPAADSKANVLDKLRMKCPQSFERFLVAPERKNVWTGGIRSQCEGVLTAKTYMNAEGDRGVYTVVPEIEGARVTVDDVYKMWLALESAMIRRESLIIVEDPAMAQVTKFRTEQWRLMNRFIRWGSSLSILFATFKKRWTYVYFLTFSFAMYGFGVLSAMHRKDPASRYSECPVNKQCDLDPDSSETCDAHISLRYLRSAQYRMFKLEDHVKRDNVNTFLISFSFAYNIIALVRNIYSHDYARQIIRVGFENSAESTKLLPLNVFEQIVNRFITFGNATTPGRADLIHWLVQNGLFYYFFVRHIPWMIQTSLEYSEREYVMETSMRYLQFRNLQGEERYEFPARNLYRTMQKDFPKNRILMELYDHYHVPSSGYYESTEFLETRKPKKLSLKDVIRRARVSYYRNW